MIKRDYKRERELQLKRGEDVGHAKRLRVRREAEATGMVKKHDGKDLDHKKPLSKGGSNKLSNIRVVSKSTNRSFPRTKTGAVK